MRQWIYKAIRRSIRLAGFIMYGVMGAAIGIPCGIIYAEEGEIEALFGVLGALLLFITVILVLCYFIQKAKTNKCIKAQEEMGCNFDFEFDENDIEWIGSTGFYREWILNKQTCLALNKNFIKQTAIVWTYQGRAHVQVVRCFCTNGKAYDLLGRFQNLEEVKERVDKLCGIYVAPELTSDPLGQEDNGDNSKNNILKIVGLVGTLSIACVVGFLVIKQANEADKARIEEPTKPVVSESSFRISDEIYRISEYDKIDNYIEKLVEVKGPKTVEDWVEIYLDQLEEGPFLQVINSSDYLIYGNLEIFYADNKSEDPDRSFLIYLLQPGGMISGVVDLPADCSYRFNNMHYYRFEEEMPVQLEMHDDTSVDYNWTNILIKEEFTQEKVVEALEYAYKYQVLGALPNNLYYIYDQDKVTLFKDTSNYDLSSATYYAYASLQEKKIYLYDFASNELIVEKEIVD